MITNLSMGPTIGGVAGLVAFLLIISFFIMKKIKDGRVDRLSWDPSASSGYDFDSPIKKNKDKKKKKKKKKDGWQMDSSSSEEERGGKGKHGAGAPPPPPPPPPAMPAAKPAKGGGNKGGVREPAPRLLLHRHLRCRPW